MEITIRPMTGTEHLYCYSQSSQLTGQTGCIGYLRADMDSNGKGFFHTWNEHRNDLKSAEFVAEFDQVIDALRSDPAYGGMLTDRDSLAKYCREHSEARLTPDGQDFGFRADTEKYTYMLRLNPMKGMYNLYCYCYNREYLEHHFDQCARGIRFINSSYDELFRIPDGDRIRISRADGSQDDKTCRYIDQYHLEVGRNLYHICEFAELMEQNGSTVIPLRSSLPEQCYGTLASTGELIIIRKGESGYYRTDIDAGSKEANRNLAEEQNRLCGVTKAQAEAMSAGSMFGWATPAANPANYDENGKMIYSKVKERNDAR